VSHEISQQDRQGSRSLRYKAYRTFVGTSEYYDILSALQFNLLTMLGLREYHYLLDIGCGSLRAGRLLIPYLQFDRYFGIEPVSYLIRLGLKHEIGESIQEVKRPQFSSNKNFQLSIFNKQFDFLLAQSIFSHTSQSQMRKCFTEAKKVMKPNAVFVATFFEGERDYEGNHWTLKATYRLKRIKELVAEQDLVCEAIDWPHPDPQRWILIHNPNNKVVLNTTSPLELQQLHKQLTYYRDGLMRIENHMYVRVGKRIKHFIDLAKFLPTALKSHFIKKNKDIYGD